MSIASETAIIIEATNRISELSLKPNPDTEDMFEIFSCSVQILSSTNRIAEEIKNANIAMEQIRSEIAPLIQP